MFVNETWWTPSGTFISVPCQTHAEPRAPEYFGSSGGEICEHETLPGSIAGVRLTSVVDLILMPLVTVSHDMFCENLNSRGIEAEPFVERIRES
jgi:hypothetical protein